MLIKKIFLLNWAMVLTACATPPPPPPALLSINDRQCDDAIELNGAISLEPEKSKKRYTVFQDIDAASPCLNLDDGNKATYAVFRLPSFAPDSIIIAGGALEAARIFAPHVSLLDQNGETLRTYEHEDYLIQGATYGIQFKPRVDEQFLLVRARPEIVGQKYDSVTIGVNSSVICTGVFCTTTYSGVDFESIRQFSYAGKISILVQDLRE